MMVWHTADEQEEAQRRKERSLRYGKGKVSAGEKFKGSLRAPGQFRVWSGIFLMAAGVLIMYVT